MEIAALVVVVIVVSACMSGGPRYRNWRGPECGTQDEVQREHLALFQTEDEPELWEDGE